MGMTRAEAHSRLAGPGLPFDVAEIEVRGTVVRVWKNAPRTLADVLAASADHGERTYLVLDDERLGYAAHLRMAYRLANVLGTRFGVRPGDRVGLAMRNLPEWSVAFWAVTSLGAIVVPLNAWFSASELAYCIADSGARLVIADRQRADLIESVVDVRLIVAREHDGAGREGSRSWEDVMTMAEVDASPPSHPIDPDDDATIFYTSGTTGVPKGAVGTHRNICSNIMTVAYRGAMKQLCRGITPAWLGGPKPHPVTLLPVPLFHVTGCHSTMAPALFSGATLILMHRWNPEQALALIEREAITNIVSVPGMVSQILESPRFPEHDTSSLISLGYGGAPAPPRLLERIADQLPQAEAENGYGLTETSSVVTFNAAESYRQKPDAVGPAIPVCDLRIVDGAGRPAPRGARGEVCVRGPNVVRGYWNQPQASAEVFRDGWLHTGDVGRLDEDGCLFLLDRVKDMLIRGGENVYCVEVENALCSHPAVVDAAVIGRPHPVLGQEVAAVVHASSAHTVSAEQLIAHCRERLAPFKVPVVIEVRKEPLPVNANGKVVKHRLQTELFPDPHDTPTPAPRTASARDTDGEISA